MFTYIMIFCSRHTFANVFYLLQMFIVAVLKPVAWNARDTHTTYENHMTDVISFPHACDVMCGFQQTCCVSCELMVLRYDFSENSVHNVFD